MRQRQSPEAATATATTPELDQAPDVNPIPARDVLDVLCDARPLPDRRSGCDRRRTRRGGRRAGDNPFNRW